MGANGTPMPEGQPAGKSDPAESASREDFDVYEPGEATAVSSGQEKDANYWGRSPTEAPDDGGRESEDRPLPDPGEPQEGNPS